MLRLRKLGELTGYTLQARDGDIGKLEQIYFDDHYWSVRYFIVHTGSWLLGKDVLIAPLAVCMGIPFPLAMSNLAREAQHYLPWAWGINGCASVISAVLATLCAIHFGFSAVILMAVLLYISVIWALPQNKRKDHSL